MPTKFDFVSPGIELREIDQSAIAPVPEQDGMLLIGRAKKGPAMKPIKINSISNFHQTFGTPMDGVKKSDPWRQGNTGAGGWAAYAAEAYLAANVGPVKFIRLAGLEESSSKKAGWNIAAGPNATDASSNTGAMGLFVSEVDDANITATTAASLQNEIPASQGGPTAAGLGFNAEMVVGGSVEVVGTANRVTLEIQYLDTSDPTASITIEFHGSVAGSASGNANIEIDLDTANTGAPVTTREHINDAVNAALTDFFTNVSAGQALAGSSFTHAQANIGDPITITLDVQGGSGNTRTITATGAISPATTAIAQNIIRYDADNDTNFANVSSRTFSGGESTSAGNGTLAAIIYTNGASVTLTGDSFDPNTYDIATSAERFTRQNTSGDWTINITDGNNTDTFAFNFTYGDASNIRSVLNTDPTLIDDGAGNNNLKYFLGESFDYNVEEMLDTSKTLVAWIAHIDPSAGSFSDHNQQLTAAKTGWFIGKEASQQKRLFRFEALDEGSDFHKNYVIRIKDLKEPSRINTDATFTVELAEVGQSASQYVEKFTGCSLNVDSTGYIGKKIGNLKLEWSVTKEKQITSGIYNNVSDYIRVEVASGVNGSHLPVGFVGPVNAGDFQFSADNASTSLEWMRGKDTLQTSNPAATNLISGAFGFGYTAQLKWPTHELSTENTNNRRNKNYPASFLHGLSYYAQSGDQYFGDIGYAKAAISPHLTADESISSAAYVFSLEYLNTDVLGAYYHDDTLANTSNIADITALILAGAKQFVAPFFGGTDGVDITIENPFNDTQLIAGGYAEYSLEVALSQVSDSDIIRYDMISIPGVTATNITQDLISLVENRGDALAIVDLAGIYQSLEDNGTTLQAGSVNDIIAEVESGFNSSYAAAYFPNVRIKDISNGNDSVLMAPPSVAAIGAISKSEAQSQPWFAPAGFNRGALAPLGGPGGASVVGTLEHLNKADRDALYDVNINPIARFPATGETVIFGQKTLQQSASALDRINVRRMMIHLKKRVGDIANTILFEQSVGATFSKFKSRVEPVLIALKNEFGVSEYKVILDETTTTPDLQDRNIMYAKVFVKPARAIEFIAVDFVVTQSGVEF